MAIYTRICPICGGQFTTPFALKKMHSGDCRKQANKRWNKQYRERDKNKPAGERRLIINDGVRVVNLKKNNELAIKIIENEIEKKRKLLSFFDPQRCIVESSTIVYLETVLSFYLERAKKYG
jgi:hypothetical protein